MAEAFRCGRRKQRNPRRNNDEDTIDATTPKLDVDVPLKENDNADVTEPETESCQGDKPTGDSPPCDVNTSGELSDNDTSPTSPPGDVIEKQKTNDGDIVPPVIIPERDVSVSKCPITNDVDSDDAARAAKDKAMAGLAPPLPGCHADRTAGGLTEDDRIQELLNRSDTAIIYPEAVSDHDDDNHGNQDAADQPNGVNSNSSNNDVHSNHTEDADSEVSGGDGEYMLRCPHCSKGFTRTYLLQEHIRSSHGDKVNKHPCPKCEESFALKSQLDKHLALHSSTSQICTICNKTFANVYRLQRHMISHDESTDLRKFKCPECQKAFKFKHHLKEHIRIHSGEKPFECTNCGKRFSHSGSYSSHMTSKKCWVVNMRMKKPEKSSAEEPHSPSNEERRPLAPKGTEDNNTTDLSLHSMYANQFRPFLPMDPATAAQYLAAAQFNGSHPFLPYAGIPGHMINHPMISGLAGSPYGFALLSGKNDSQKTARTKLDLEEGEMAEGMPPHKSMKLETLPVKEEQQGDENQNTETDPAAIIDEAAQTSHPEIKKEAVDEQEVAGNGEEQGERESSDEKDQTTEGEVTKDEDASTAKTPTANMNEIKKVLEILDNTVTQQKQLHADDKSAISKLTNQNTEDCSEDKTDAKVEKEEQTTTEHSDTESCTQAEGKDSLPCRYCRQQFSSPVDLHQHERYLCNQNSEIRPTSDASPSHANASSPTPAQQPQTPTSPNHSINESSNVVSPGRSYIDAEKGSEDENSASQSEADGFIDKEGRQYRVRSMLTDDQQRILKAHYAVNPRPNKFELLQISSAVSFPKRVVQVWFQNMRARDRRRGNPIPAPSSSSSTTSVATAALLAGTANGSTWSPAKKTTPTTPYIPVVPQLPLSLLTGGTNVVYPYSSPAAHPKLNGQQSSSSSSGSPHRPSPSPANLAFTMQVEPLDLSTKRSPSTSLSSCGSPPPTPQPSGEGEEEGGVLNLSKRSNSPRVADIPSLEKTLENSPIFKYMQQEGMIQQGSNGVIATGSDGNASSHSNRSTPNLHPPLVRPGFRIDPQLPTESAVFPVPAATTQMGSPFIHRGSPVLPVGSPSMSPPSSLESSFNSTMSLDSSGMENGLTRKRSRKKTWRQVGLPMESEQVALEFDDALMIDEGNLSHSKKRKSWKAHKVDVEEGMYACDQCDKLFNKQSSLARHKYEHSGARPFNCGECGKAFKHKHHLTEHRRLHSGEKPFVCSKCGKRFSHSGSFSQHMNHRYKYCKPLRGAAGTSENDSGSEHGSEPAIIADTMEN